MIFHTGHSGIGTGMPGGGGIRLKYGNPMDIDDVAVDFPDMPIILAHPSFPWQDEAISVCLHKPQVYIDLSGWSPKYFSPMLIQYANTLLKTQSAVRLRLPADHAGPLAGRFRQDRHPRGSAPIDPEGKCLAASRAISGSLAEPAVLLQNTKRLNETLILRHSCQCHNHLSGVGEIY